ncbi:hypothetical protein F3Y22_tig00110328pilonHSYRG01246 [Hibiscus syriacus]|uniref:Uncharacterized protein n=1 Tax=Hibiscus syriacus TaxID=106335 RepID=A0A6A3AZ60_HIBSY|nr:hypothetical protein F3Y22_tig00110328pilonHSYRG01246 [Hibiscus syriacus]
MGFWALFEVASIAHLQAFDKLLGAFWHLITIVFVVFTPSLMFASLANTVTFQDIIHGGLCPELGKSSLHVVPACNEDGSPFGDRDACTALGLSYSSFSMALGGFYIWTIGFQLIKASSLKLRALEADGDFASKQANKSLDATPETRLLKGESEEQVAIIVTLGFIFGTIVWLRSLIIGPGAPLRVIQDTVKLLGYEVLSHNFLIVTYWLRSSTIKPMAIIGVVCVRFIILPMSVSVSLKQLGTSASYRPTRFPLRAYGSVYSATGHEYWNHDAALQCGSTSVRSSSCGRTWLLL